MVESHHHEIAPREYIDGDYDVVVIIEANLARSGDWMTTADEKIRHGIDHVLVDEEPNVSRS